MKKYILTACMMVVCGVMSAQNLSRRVTEYAEFKPAVIHLVTGKDVSTPLANIFLKNSTLVYKSGTKTKEAFTNNLKSVEFDDRTYYRIDSVLAYRVDSVGTGQLFCARVIDMPTFRRMVLNNRQITNIQVGDQISTTTLDLIDQDQVEYPLLNYYYISYGGKVVRAHDHEVLRLTPKAKRRQFWAIVREPTFSWTNEASLLKLLKAIASD